MKFFYISILSICNLLFSFGLYNKEEIYFTFQRQENKVLNDIGKIISIDKITKDSIFAYANKKEMKDFEKLNIKFKILPNPSLNLNKYKIKMANTVEEMSEWNRYPTYDVFEQMIKNVASSHPEIVRLDTIGFSVEKRPIFVLKITDNPDINEAEPEIYYSAQMHGDEVVDYIVALYLINYLVDNYQSNPLVTKLINNLEIYINPLANPDGTYAKGNHTIIGATRNNSNHVDLNRNFKDPIHGDHPDGNYWQPENIVQMNFFSKRNFVFSTNTHSGSELVNYPWDGWKEKHPDDEWWIHFARIYADLAQENSPNGYFTGQSNGITNGYAWYSISGGRQDYANYFVHCREFVLELSNIKMLSSSLLPNHCQYNLDASLAFFERALYGIKGIISDTEGNPLYAKIEVLNHDHKNSFIMSDRDKGNYLRMIAPGVYDIKFSAPGYISQTVEGLKVDDYNQSVIQDIVLLKKASPNLLSVTDTIADITQQMQINIEVDTEDSIKQIWMFYNFGSQTDSVKMLRDLSLQNQKYTANLPIMNDPITASGFFKFQLEGYDIKSRDYSLIWKKFVNFNEDFEAGSLPFENWTLYPKLDLNNWKIGADSYHGTKSLFHGKNIRRESDDWIILPGIIPGKNSKLKFYQKNTEMDLYSYHGVWLSTENNSPDSGAFYELKQFDTYVPEYQKEEINLSEYQGKEIYIGFRYQGYNASSWMLDDIFIRDIKHTNSIEDEVVDKNIQLINVYPNPFNPTTQISFYTKKESFVNLIIYNSRGQEIKVLIKENLRKGLHNVKFDGSYLNSGIYFYRLSSDKKLMYQGKMVLIK